MGNQEKKKELMKPETKTALGAVVMVLVLVPCLWLCSSADSTINIGHLIAIFIMGLVMGGLVVCVMSRFVAWDTDKNEPLLMLMGLLYLVFALPFAIGMFPLSKYHNLTQIERDKRIVEVFQITKKEDGVEVLLPDEYASENSYLKKVFYIGWEGLGKEQRKWGEIAVPCQEGDKYWYKGKLILPTGAGTSAELKLVFFFDHAWMDHRETRQISLVSP